MIRNNTITQFFDFQYLPALILCALCFYFTYHIFQGKRSIGSYLTNQITIEEKHEQLSLLKEQNASLENKVEKLRVDTLDPDFLEERARYLLGYTDDDEVIILR